MKIKSDMFKKYRESSIKFTKKYAKSSFYWLKNIASPKIHKFGEQVVNKITTDKDSNNWSNLKSSRKWNKSIIWTLVSIAGFGIVWSIFARIDETVQAIGKIEPLGSTLDVKVPMGGVIKKVFVKEGQLVDLNQILLELDTTAVKSKLKALEQVKSQTIADILLSRGQLGENIDDSVLSENQKLRLKSLQEEYQSRINASREGVNQALYQLESSKVKHLSVKDTLEIRRNILNDLEPLVTSGAISRIKFLKEKQEVIQLEGQFKSSLSDLKKAEAAYDEASNRLINTIAASKIDFSTKIEENSKQIAQLDNQISDASLTLSYQAIKSPVAGYVFDLQATTPGFVVNNELPILKVVPVDEIVARILVSNQQIGFIKKNQLVSIRIDAYPYSEFGEVKGTIESIGSDVLEPDEKYQFFRFPVTVKLEQPFLEHKGNKLKIFSGMSVQANIILRQRPVISIFTEQVMPFWDSLKQL
tara:strand:+ start:1289 stop:2707 length:1419 start_codon:yes stop_codon:yes gene_type:complete